MIIMIIIIIVIITSPFPIEQGIGSIGYRKAAMVYLKGQQSTQMSCSCGLNLNPVICSANYNKVYDNIIIIVIITIAI